VTGRSGFVSSGRYAAGPSYDLGLPNPMKLIPFATSAILELARQQGTMQLIALWNGRAGEWSWRSPDFVERAREVLAGDDIIDPTIYSYGTRGVMVDMDYAILRPKQPGQRRLLALDGGGYGPYYARNSQKLEADLRAASGAGESFRLSDFFDFIGGHQRARS